MTGLDRYSTPQMTALFSREQQIDHWAWIEEEAARAQGAPNDVLLDMRMTPQPTVIDLDAEEEITRHDVVAFLNVWRRGMSAEAAGWVHRGMTSSDLVDTANALRMHRAEGLILEKLYSLRFALASHADTHWDTVRVGRTHGQTAEVTTWGHRIGEFAFAVDRAIERFKMLERWFCQGKLSGPVGDYKRVSREQETNFLLSLKLCQPRLTSQVVMRDGYADFMFCLAQAATAIEAVALEIRLSARSDTGEVSEGFTHGQRGSSSMPHKRNPIKAEQLCGLAKIVRAQVDPVMQGVALHHERDISHSSVERIALETACQVTHYMALQATDMVNRLVVNTNQMSERVVQSPEVGSAFVKDQLIAAGIEPDVAWRVADQAFGRYKETWLNLSLQDALRYGWARVMEGPIPVNPHEIADKLRNFSAHDGTEYARELLQRFYNRP